MRNNMNGKSLTALAVVLFFVSTVSAEDIEIPSALIKLIDQAEIPALEAGPLIEITAHEGDRIQANGVLGQMDDSDAQLVCERTQREVDIAKTQAESRVKIESAMAGLGLADADLKRALE